MSLKITPAYPSPIERLVQLNAIEYLLRLLKDEEVADEVRSESFIAIVEIGQIDKVIYLVQDPNEDPSFRVDLCWNLIELRRFDEAIEALIEVIHDSSAGFQPRRRAANTLSYLGQGSKLLNVALDRKVDVDLRLEIIRLLEEMGLINEAGQVCVDLALDSRLGSDTRQNAIRHLWKWREEIDSSIINNLQILINNCGESAVSKEARKILNGGI